MIPFIPRPTLRECLRMLFAALFSVACSPSSSGSVDTRPIAEASCQRAAECLGAAFAHDYSSVDDCVSSVAPDIRVSGNSTQSCVDSCSQAYRAQPCISIGTTPAACSGCQ